jgi:hypothetical protein
VTEKNGGVKRVVYVGVAHVEVRKRPNVEGAQRFRGSQVRI